MWVIYFRNITTTTSSRKIILYLYNGYGKVYLGGHLILIVLTQDIVTKTVPAVPARAFW